MTSSDDLAACSPMLLNEMYAQVTGQGWWGVLYRGHSWLARSFLPFDLSSLERSFDATGILLTMKQKWNTKDSVSVVYFCVTNHPKHSGLEQYHLFAHSSTIYRTKLGSSAGLSLGLCMLGNWLNVGWSWMASMEMSGKAGLAGPFSIWSLSSLGLFIWFPILQEARTFLHDVFRARWWQQRLLED